MPVTSSHNFPNDTPLLHVYGQYCNHDSAHIVGNVEGLRALRDAIDQALAVRQSDVFSSASPQPSPAAASTNVFADDGEGYTVLVAVTDEPRLDGLALPYAAEEFQPHSPERGKQLHNNLVALFGSKEEYRQLARGRDR